MKTTGEQVLKHYVERLLYWKDKNTRARQSTTMKNNATMTTIKHGVQRQIASSAIPMGRALQQRQFWLSGCFLEKKQG
jgi:hypothetical protein